MDNTEQYIKMRLAAIPDLGIGTKPQVICSMEWINSSVFIDEKGDWYYTDDWERGATQLERQDQLQEMYRQDRTVTQKETTLEILSDFAYWSLNCPDENYKYVKEFTSMEQLWLAFVMKEKYNKIWDGDKWVRKLG